MNQEKRQATLTNLLHTYNDQNYPLCLQIATALLAKDPNNAQVWFICAMSLYYLGDVARAIDYLKNAQNLAPNDESIAINLSELLRKAGSLKSAALTLAPFLPSTNPDIYFNLARILSQADETEHAIAAYQEVLKLSPNDTQAAYNLANLYAKVEAYPQAIALYKTCQSLEAHFNLAHTYVMVDDVDSALILYKNLEAYFAPRLKELGESEELYQAYNASRADFYFNFANALRYAGKSREAERLYQKCYMIAPKFEYVINYAHLLLSVGVLERGFGYYQERLKLHKEQTLDNARFFQSSRHIAVLPEPAAIRECIKNARVLLFHEQGFGDSVMFARFIDSLECKEKYVFVQAPLRRLFAKRFNVVGEEFNDFDYCISLPSLPYVLGISLLEDFAHNALYLRDVFATTPAHSPSALDEFALLDSATQVVRDSCLEGIVETFTTPTPDTTKPLRIGIFFHSNPNFAYAAYKSIPLEKLLASFGSCAQKGLTFSLHCIQPEPLESIVEKPTLKSLTTESKSSLESLQTPATNTQDRVLYTYALHDFYDTARLITAMDLVVSVDSVVAHLAIALGVPCATLAYKRYDWRWGEIGKSRFSGYCGGEVFAQNVYGQWEQVLQELESYLLRMG